MSECEFKKQIANEIARTDMDVMNVLRIIDKARKDFPIEDWKLRSKSVVSYEESAKVIDWFLKWFGAK